MSTAELRKHLIEMINKTDNEGILNDINRLLEIEKEAKAIYDLNEKQIDSINESRQQYKKGQTPDNEFLTVFLPIVIFKEKDSDYLMAACLPLDIYSAGNTIEEAETAINEHIELFLEETTRMGTLQKCLIDLGWNFNTTDVAKVDPPKILLSEIFQKFGNHLLSVTNRQTNIPLPFYRVSFSSIGIL
jgi:predicted RNase H-like HicB family nuclease